MTKMESTDPIERKDYYEPRIAQTSVPTFHRATAVMDRCEIEMLGQYNSETARGIMHTVEWREKMVRLQRKFNLQQYGTEAPEPGMVYMRPAPTR